MDETNKRPLTILFTDVKGSTELRGSRGDALADDILALHEQIVRTNVARFGGHEAKFLGDGFLTDFESPDAAVRCAVAIQRDLEQHNVEDPDRQVQVRIGVHHGTVSERDGNLYGQAVHAAARITAEAAACQIFVSALVKDLIGKDGSSAFVDRGLFWLKGFPDRWRLYEVPWRDQPARGPAPAPAPALTPFVGRDEERAALRAAVDNALAGRGRLVFVAGEAGVGKSRLVQEVTQEAEARGMRVLSGHCVEMRSSPPYLPFIEIVEQSITSPRSTLALRDALGDTAPEIARIVPALRRVFPDLAPPTDLPAELAPRFLWNSVQEFIERASRKQPLLLVLEDLHWADESTILLTEYLAAQVPDMPVLVIGTYRDIEVGIRHPLARSVNELSRRRLIDRISLTPLPLDGVAAMVEGLARQTAPERLVRMINSETEGNPFFVEEVFFHLTESGVLLDENGRVRSDLRMDEVDVPDSIRLVIEQRLERLSSSTRGVLLGAAVIGRAFVPDLVGKVAQVDADVLIDSLDEGERARLIVPLREDDRLGFSHELIRQTLLADTSTIRRERLHLRAADAIEASYADDIEAHSADLAHHLSLAGRSSDRPRLIRYLKMAGERATEATAFEDAVGNFTDALALVPADDADARGELLERLAMAQRSVGEWDTALETMNHALDLYESSGNTEAFGRLSWAFVYQLSWAGRFVEGVAVAQRALAALGQVPSSNLARLLSAAGWAMSLGGDYPSSNAMFDQARALAEQIGDDRALADVLHMETIHHMGFAEFDRGVHSGLRAAEVFEAQGARWDLCSVRAFVIFEDGAFGRTEQADSLAQPTMAMARRLGHLGAIFMLLANSARRDGVMAGDLPALDGIGQQMVEVCEQGGLPWLYVGHIYVGLAAHWQGDWDRAEHELRVAVDLEPAAAYAGQSAALLAWHLAHQGRAKEVIDLFDAWKSALPVSGQVNTIGAWNMLCGFVEALYLIGQGEGAAALAPLVAEALKAVGDWITFDCRLASTRAGIAAAAARQWDEAEEHYLAALQKAEEISDRMEQADLRRLYGRLLLDRNTDGDAAQAQRLLAEAIERYRAMGMPNHVRVAQEMVAKASV